MKAVYTFVLILFVQSVAAGQESKIDRITPLDEQRHHDKFDKIDRFNLDQLKPGKDSIFTKLEQRNSIRVFKVPDKEMAKMPKMKIEEDFHHAIRIKRYDLTYPYTREIKPRDSISSNELRLYQPLNKKQEKE